MNSFKPDPKDCLDIILTDIQLHTQKKRNPNSFGRQFVKAVHGSKERRAYSNLKSPGEYGRISDLIMPAGMDQLYDLARKKGKKYIRFFGFKDGLRVDLGPDAKEKIDSIIKKHLQNKK